MLGSLEAKVLGVLEDKKEASVREVVDELNERDEGEELAYTTVGTILDRLHEKGLVERTEEPYKGGSRYVYEYRNIREEYINDVLQDVVALFGEEGIDELKERVGDVSDGELESLKHDTENGSGNSSGAELDGRDADEVSRTGHGRED
ncbi:MAG: BlaI/MecI/CopY family transcriptional regulator [Halobacteria archaeon]|nr:BlaI/MecI/CopY family transcriptional regulator [Halobacteria archaeon]